MLKKHPCTYILPDKANSAKKVSLTATLPKIIAYANIDTHHIEEFLLDCNSSGECSEEVDHTIIHAIKMLGLIDPTLTLTIMGQTTDSGGGGTLFSLAQSLRNLGMPGMAAAYLVGS